MHGASHCPNVGLWGIYCFLFHDLVAKKNERNYADSRKWIFKDDKHLKDFSIDRLSQTTLVLDNSLFSQKTTFRNDKMRSHECMYFLFQTQWIKRFFFAFFFWKMQGMSNNVSWSCMSEHNMQTMEIKYMQLAE